MKYSDDKTHYDDIKNIVSDTEQKNAADTDNVVMPKIERSDERKEHISDNKTDGADVTTSFAGELTAAAIKTVAAVLSFAAMLVCILAVALPLNAMRIFNRLGLGERAVDFGERYISGELDEYGAGSADRSGNYNKLSATPSLTNSDFTEALYVCNSISYKLMNEAYASGDTARGGYYAERLEKYTRMYLSLNNVGAVSAATDKKNIASMPSAALHPLVYSYEHEMRVMNYRARAYLGKTDFLTYDNRSNELGVMTTLDERYRKFFGTVPDDRNALITLLDEFADFADQLGEYLDVEFLRAGVENDPSAKRDVWSDGKLFPQTPVNSELYLKNECLNVLTGREFSLFILGLDDITETRSGFTQLYNNLKCFTKYAQWAVDFEPTDGADRQAEQLHKLYWLQTLASASERLWYMENLMYYSRDMFGASGKAIVDEYTTCQSYAQVRYDSRQYQISEVYAIELRKYVSQFQSQGE